MVTGKWRENHVLHGWNVGTWREGAKREAVKSEVEAGHGGTSLHWGG
jgi:hypothetical protein